MKRLYFILKGDLQSLVNRAVSAAKNGTEIVGLILDNGYYLELAFCRNRSRRVGSFAFFANEVRTVVAAANRLGHEVVGTFHSHPAALAEPGESDVANAPDDSLMLIVDCLAREAALWRIKNDKARKLPLRVLENPVKS
jgi:proteasome lid subunit RPN8/RPN11